MAKRVFISTIIFLGILASSSLAQGNAQATMRVSVKVVSGSSVEVNKPELVYLSNRDADLGVLTLTGVSQSAFIHSSKKITLMEKNGGKLSMDIESLRSYEGNTDRLKLSGKYNGEMLSSLYQGELTTTIEYL